MKQETMTAAEYRLETQKSRDESESAKVRRLFLFHIKGRRLPVPRSKDHAEGEVVFMDGEIVARHTKARKLKTNASPKWAFDFAWPDHRIAVEVEGVTVVKAGNMFLIGGRHGTIDGFSEDCEKYAWAAVQGWRLMRFTQNQVKQGLAIDMLVRLFAATEDPVRVEVPRMVFVPLDDVTDPGVGFEGPGAVSLITDAMLDEERKRLTDELSFAPMKPER